MWYDIKNDEAFMHNLHNSRMRTVTTQTFVVKYVTNASPDVVMFVLRDSFFRVLKLCLYTYFSIVCRYLGIYVHL